MEIISRPRVKLPGGNSKIYIPGLNGGFDPATLTGLKVRSESALPDPFYKDTDNSLTTPAELGDPAYTFRDSSGLGNNSIGINGLQTIPTVVTGPNGLLAIGGDGGWLKAVGIAPPTGTAAASPYWVAMVVRADMSASGICTFFSDPAATLAWRSSSETPSFNRNGTTPAVTAKLTAGTSAEWRLLLFRMGTAGTATGSVFVDGQGLGGGALPDTLTTGDMQWMTFNGSFTLDVPVAAVWYGLGDLPVSDITGLHSYCRATYGTTAFIADPIVPCVGNSIVSGYGLSDPSTQSWPAKLNILIGGNTVINLGIAGQTTDTMLATAPGVVWPLGCSTSGHVVFALEGTNQLAGGDSAATVLAKLTALYDGYRDAGFAPKRVIVCTILPAAIIPNDADRLAVNTGLRSLCTARGYTLCDFAGDPDMGGTGQNVPPLFQADGTHVEDAGTDRMAPIAYAAWQAATV